MNGVYRAAYSIPGDTNEGIVFLDNGKLYGADVTHYFHGTYSATGSNFKADIKRYQHANRGYNMGGGGSEISVIGVIEGNKVKGDGTIPGVPVKMKIVLDLISKL